MSNKVEVDLISRDPNALNHHIQVMFDDIIAEPEGIRSADWFLFFTLVSDATQILYSKY
jgi:hypothetical protein